MNENCNRLSEFKAVLVFSDIFVVLCRGFLPESKIKNAVFNIEILNHLKDLMCDHSYILEEWLVHDKNSSEQSVRSVCDFSAHNLLNNLFSALNLAPFARFCS